tara:strand:+ start:127120 stop:129018 length:1899 start_codon:yes stop_codon:yes gene_type:complete
MLKFYTTLLFIASFIANAQTNFSVSEIPTELKTNANAVIRLNETVVTLDDYNEMSTNYHYVVTVFNKRGLSAVVSESYYDASSSIRDIRARVYDKNGYEIKKYKKRDFIDVSVSGGNLYTDNRMLYLHYTPTEYPFTFEFITEEKSSSTGFLPRWDPSPIYEVSVQYSKYTLKNEKEIPLVTRKFNLEDFNVNVKETPTEYSYSIENVPPVEREYLSPHYTEFTPVVKFALKKFMLEGTYAEVSSWEDFGRWQNEKLLYNRDILPQQTIQKVSNLVSNYETDREKAKAIYEYMQDKTRYISVQVGIGGWQPSTAEEVDKLSYGDCKGLTNYTKALLKSQGIESYYTIVNAGEDGQDIDEDFVAIQGNHVILTVPLEDEMVFLECTNQLVPFNFIGTHTDDRKVVMITPEGGKVVKTHSYSAEDNMRDFKATVVISDDFKISGKVNQLSTGLQYDRAFGLETYKTDEVTMHYKERWGHLNNMALSDIGFINDKDVISFSENLTFEADNYVSKAGDRILMNPNIFNRFNYIPYDSKKRSQEVEIRRGSTYKDEITILLPTGYTIESLFEPQEIETEFGSYKSSLEQVNSSKVIYRREVLQKTGRFPKESYENYISFVKSMVKKDKSKIILQKVE